MRSVITGLIVGFVWLLAAYWGLRGWFVDVTALPTAIYTGVMALLTTLLLVNERYPARSGGGKAKRRPDGDAYAVKVRALLEIMDGDEREAFKEAMKKRLLESIASGKADDVQTLADLMRNWNR
jgi:hypothetical protein